MRSIFRRFNGSFPAIALSLFCLATVSAQAQTQSRDPRVISARAGGINFISGEARGKLRGRGDWQTLTTKDNLRKGDTVETGAGGQLEVLLNPGSYLRLGENSEFTLADDSLAGLRLSLSRGSALIEAAGLTELRVSILVNTPQTKIEIVRSGLYRINVRTANSTEVAVHKGRALVGSEQALIKGGNVARVGGGGVEIAKLNKKERDGLDLWSRERAGMLAKANGKISTRSVNTLLASFDANDYWSNGFGLSGGFWYFDVRSSCYVYIPRGYGWSSPYGHHYSSVLSGPYGRVCNRCAPWNHDNRDTFGNSAADGFPNNSSRSVNTRNFPSYPSKSAPVFRPPAETMKSRDKMINNQ